MNGRRVGSEVAAEELKHSESIGIRYGWEFIIEFHSDTIIANDSGFVNREIRRKARPQHQHTLLTTTIPNTKPKMFHKNTGQRKSKTERSRRKRKKRIHVVDEKRKEKKSAEHFIFYAFCFRFV